MAISFFWFITYKSFSSLSGNKTRVDDHDQEGNESLQSKNRQGVLRLQEINPRYEF